jgi:hypothetical protein
MHVKKYRGESVIHMLQHDLREKIQDHIDMSINNYIDMGDSFSECESANDVLNKMNDIIRERTNNATIRKDAVRMVKVIIHQPDYLGRETNLDFFNSALEAFKKKFGAENMIMAALHQDEKGQPHMHYNFIPLTKENRLCAKKIINRNMLKTFHQEIEKEIGYKITLDEPEKRKTLSKENYIILQRMKEEIAKNNEKIENQKENIEKNEKKIELQLEEIKKNEKILIELDKNEEKNEKIENEKEKNENIFKNIISKNENIEYKNDLKERMKEIEEERKKRTGYRLSFPLPAPEEEIEENNQRRGLTR